MWSYLLIYILGVIVTFGVVVFDDTHELFREVYDKAYGGESKPDALDSSRGWTATWIGLAWPATMTIFTLIMIVAYIKVYVIQTNPLNMLYDKTVEWMRFW